MLLTTPHYTVQKLSVIRTKQKRTSSSSGRYDFIEMNGQHFDSNKNIQLKSEIIL